MCCTMVRTCESSFAPFRSQKLSWQRIHQRSPQTSTDKHMHIFRVIGNPYLDLQDLDWCLFAQWDGHRIGCCQILQASSRLHQTWLFLIPDPKISHPSRTRSILQASGGDCFDSSQRGNSLAGGLLWIPAPLSWQRWQCHPGQPIKAMFGSVSWCFLPPGALPRHHRSLWDGWGTCALPRAWVQILPCRSMASPPGTSRSAFGNAARANRPIAMWTCRSEL